MSQSPGWVCEQARSADAVARGNGLGRRYLVAPR